MYFVFICIQLESSYQPDQEKSKLYTIFYYHNNLLHKENIISVEYITPADPIKSVSPTQSADSTTSALEVSESQATTFLS